MRRDIDDIEFTAIGPALGVREPTVVGGQQDKVVSVGFVPQKKIATIKKTVLTPLQSPLWKRVIQNTLSITIDHLFITLLLGGLYLVAERLYLAFGYGQWNTLIAESIVLWVFFTLAAVLYLFYFLFFFQFKVPSLGRLAVFGNH
jgi:hypothetical protein